MRAVARLVGTDRTSAVGSLLVVSGLMLLVYAGGMYWDLLPGSRVSMPRPAALDRPRAVERTQPAANPTAVSARVEPVQPVPEPAPGSATIDSSAGRTVAPVAPEVAAAPSSETGDLALPAGSPASVIEPPDPAIYAAPLEPADARAWRDASSRPPPARAVGLRITRIELETQVVPAGVVLNTDGELEWETLPFVAAHYVQTSLVGTRGNAVIAGHVVTRFEGNVFRDLYLLDIGDTIDTFTEEGRFTYTVEDLKLVPPTAVEVLAATEEPLLTLVTCGGEFNPRTRQFSERLVVVARLTDWGRHSIS